jgi:16S rRNA (cytidine1402-2'-O)-methyltransferase
VDEERQVRPGHLYVVATPIGNLGDLSPRAQGVLAQVDLIAAEDTRTSGVLLQHFGIGTRVVAFHEHNEDRIAEELIRRLKSGDSIALVSDAGTPLVSDPGFALVRAARAANLPVIALPGPCAAIAALSISGLPTDSFVFAGFLPPKATARRARLQELLGEMRTLIFYEASHRIVECVEEIAAVFGAQRRLCLAREISKRFEESVVAGAAEVAAWLKEDANRSRGEFVLVLAGAQAVKDDLAEADRVLRLLLRELPAARAAKLAAEITGAPRNALYDLALRLSAGRPE